MMKKTYTFELNENSDFEVLTDILKKFQLYPSSTNALLAYRDVEDTTSIEKIALIFPKQFDYYNENNFSYRIIEGRYFSESEIEEGRKVIVLDYMEYKRNYSENLIGDVISYGGINFTIIGINHDINNSRTILLYSTICNSTELKDMIHFHIDNIELLFPQKLTRNTLKTINKDFEEATERVISIQSLYSQVISSIIPFLVIYILFIVLINCLFIICVKQLFLVVDAVNNYRYTVLVRLGMNEIMWKTSSILFVEECLLVSYFISIFVFYGISSITNRAGFHTELSRGYVVIIFCLLQVIIIPTLQILKKHKKYGRLES